MFLWAIAIFPVDAQVTDKTGFYRRTESSEFDRAGKLRSLMIDEELVPAGSVLGEKGMIYSILTVDGRTIINERDEATYICAWRAPALGLSGMYTPNSAELNEFFSILFKSAAHFSSSVETKNVPSRTFFGQQAKGTKILFDDGSVQTTWSKKIAGNDVDFYAEGTSATGRSLRRITVFRPPRKSDFARFDTKVHAPFAAPDAKGYLQAWCWQFTGKNLPFKEYCKELTQLARDSVLLPPGGR